MTGERIARRLTAIVATGLVCGVALANVAHSQKNDDFAALNAELVRLYGAGKYAEATEVAKRLLANREKSLGPTHPEVDTALSNLAKLYRLQGRYSEAEPLLRRSLSIREKTQGTSVTLISSALNDLAGVLRDQGRYSEAEPLLRRSLSIREKALGPEDTSVAALRNNLAEILRAQGRYAEAEPLYKRDLAIIEKARGPHDISVAISLSNLAVLYHDQGRYTDAIPLLERSLSIREKALGPEHRDLALTLGNLAGLYHAQGRNAEAEPLYKRSLAIREKELGPEHPDVALSLNNLAELYRDQARYTEAEQLLKRALSIREKVLGNGHPAVGHSLGNLASLHHQQGRYADAEAMFVRSIAVIEKALGSEHPDVAHALTKLANLCGDQGRYAEAESLQRRALVIREKVLGGEHPDVGHSLNNIAVLYKEQGRYADAELYYKRSLAIGEKALGPDHAEVATTLNNLAQVYESQARYAEAEPLYKRSLSAYEKALGPEHPMVALSLNNLAGLYFKQGRYGEAELLLRRSLAIREKALGPEHSDVAASLNNLGELYRQQTRYSDAEPLYRRAASVLENALGSQHPAVATVLNNLALLLQSQLSYVEAEPLYRRSLAIREKAHGPEHPDVATSLNNIAELYRRQGRFAEAEPLFKRSLVIAEKALGPGHPRITEHLNNLAQLAFEQSDWAGAVGYLRRGADLSRRRAERGFLGGRVEGFGGEAQQLLIKSIHRLAHQGGGPDALIAAETFESAQWAQTSEAAITFAQIAVRSHKGSTDLATLVRERQDLVNEWNIKDRQLITAKGELLEKRNVDAEKALASRVAAIDIRLAEIDQQLARDFPDYAALRSPAPLSVKDVQAQLGADEALVLILETPEWKPAPEETFIWVVTKSGLRWARSDLGAVSLLQEVKALRCGIDRTAWYGNGAEKCARSLGLPPDKVPGANQSLPFDHSRAHRLYSALFGDVQDLVSGKHLLIVSSGPLSQLPLQVLVTKQPTSGEPRAIAWLSREHALTVLPAVSSLNALRRVGKPSSASRPIIGFGNPLLDGPDERYANRAKLAREKQQCPEGPSRQIPAPDPRRSLVAIETRGGLADVARIREQEPLPETADELCDVARDLKASLRDIRLGAQATEREIKRLSESGELAKYRMVHFATHGYLAGQLDGAHEPGLILTPPNKATEEDDGYLSASEIAALKLDADWVILSACNTAAGAATSADMLSGLARAFIYAQARALLVSHWEVYSDATVKLITTSIREMARDTKVGRAEALRRSMLALIDKGQPHEAHPAFWAPFVVVGEGGAGR
jgi:tetratricopeptide (TPR) repeat protein/CHAT domain-containing protein